MTGQFDQQRLFDPGPEDTTPSFYRRMNRELNPIEGAFKPMSGWPNAAHERFAGKADSGNTTNENHLPMFMSAREIQDKYQPLDGDRQDANDYREGSATGRSYLTGGVVQNYPRREFNSAGGFGTVQNTDRNYTRSSREESDDELWDRKYGEATMDRDDYMEEVRGAPGSARYDRPGGGETRASGTWRDTWKGPSRTDNTPHKTQTYEPFEQVYGGGESIRDAVIREGVKSPLSLGRQFGSMGKPMIAGGHHRIAVMARERPDELMPVMHHESVRAAQQRSPYWKYT